MFRAAIAGLSLAILSATALAQAPACAQESLMKALDFDVLREITADQGLTLTDEGVDEEGDYYLSVKTETGLQFSLYGAVCSSSDPAVGCAAVNILASFLLDDEHQAAEVMDTISYAFMKVYRSQDDVAISRYVIFDDGITTGNLAANLRVFVEIAEKVWDQLADAGVLED